MGPNTYVDSVMQGRDQEIVPALVHFYAGESPLVLDTTYGEGRFWQRHRPPNLVGADLLGADVTADFNALPFLPAIFDVVVFDPPHIIRKVGYRDTKQSVHAIYNLSAFSGGFSRALEEAYRVTSPGGVLICKVSDEVSKHGWAHVRLVQQGEEAGWVPYDFIVKLRHPSIRNTSQQQHRARKRHSFFVVFKK